MKSKAIWKGVVAGAAGGLAGAWTMNQAQAAITKIKKQNRQDGESKEKSGEPEDATMKAADKIVSMPTGYHLSHEERKKAGPIVHYAFGAAAGAAYGAVTEPLGGVTRAAGPIFGSALFLVADEIGVPLAGLSGPPTQTPISSHLQALAAHLVYGVTADLVRRGVRAAL